VAAPALYIRISLVFLNFIRRRPSEPTGLLLIHHFIFHLGGRRMARVIKRDNGGRAGARIVRALVQFINFFSGGFFIFSSVLNSRRLPQQQHIKQSTANHPCACLPARAPGKILRVLNIGSDE
jgi:hypothetical protein